MDAADIRVKELMDAGHPEFYARLIDQMEREKEEIQAVLITKENEIEDILRDKEITIRIAEQTVYNAIQVLTANGHWSVQQKLNSLANDMSTLASLRQTPLSQVYPYYNQQDCHSRRAEAPLLHVDEREDRKSIEIQFPRASCIGCPYRLDQNSWDILSSDRNTYTLRKLVTRLHLAISCIQTASVLA